jgi:hypothetical protein
MEQHLPARVNAFLNHKWGSHAHSANGATPKSNGATTTTTH